jgi:hypothetical protein
LAQAKSEASDKRAVKAAKKRTPQQQKMKDCGAKQQVHKKDETTKGQADYRKFLSASLKG